jgi:hypothetical protein
MAYITSEQVKQMRNEIKALFPKTFKFSITREHHSVVNVNIMATPLAIEAHPNRELKNHKTIKKIIKSVIDNGNFNHSDSMTDYFHVGWYTHIQLGKWDKPYQQIQ